MPTELQKEFLERYEPIHDRFIKYCSSHAYGLLDTEDLAHETILVTLQKFHSIRDKNRLLFFMIGVAGNITKVLFRRKKFKSCFDEEALKKLESRLYDPEVALDVHYLYKALNQLHPKEKEAILLFEVSGFSVKEIGELQKANEGAIKTRLSRARKKLREMLSDEPVSIKSDSAVSTLFTFLL